MIGQGELQARRPELDGLRGIAALVVMLFHVLSSVELNSGLRPGYVMVDVFFVISGVVLSCSYLSFRLTVVEFAVRRIGRLAPLHWSTLMILVLCEVLLAPFGREAAPANQMVLGLLLNLFLLHGLPLINTLTWNTPSWSISVELWGNIVWYYLGKAGLLQTGFVAGAWLLAASSLYQGYATTDVNLHPLGIVNGGILRFACGFTSGILISRFCLRPVARSIMILLVAVPATFMLIWISADLVASPYLERGDFALSVLLSPLVVLAAVQVPIYRKLLSTKLPLFLGRTSYSVYLWHILVLKAVNLLLPTFSSSNRVLLVVALVYVIAVYSERLIERPGRSLHFG